MIRSHHTLGFLALLALCLPGEAGILDHFKKKDSCDTGCSIDARPAIERPCYEIVRTYQRGFAQAPLRCDTCSPGVACDHITQQCGWPCPPAGCVTDCISGCDSSCDVELSELIQESKTACYARHRRLAVVKLGRKFCCKTHPQLMPALVYALNDADECVRLAAADKIGDQLRANPCCCAPYIICALKLSLSDCDPQVRTQSEQALIACGYRIVSQTACSTATGDCLPQFSTPVTFPASQVPAAPAPVPPSETAPSKPPEFFPPVDPGLTVPGGEVPAVKATPMPPAVPPAQVQALTPKARNVAKETPDEFLAPTQGIIR